MTASFRFSLAFSGIFDELLSTQIVNVARFARNFECDFLDDFQTLCNFRDLNALLKNVILTVIRQPIFGDENC